MDTLLHRFDSSFITHNIRYCSWRSPFGLFNIAFIDLPWVLCCDFVMTAIENGPFGLRELNGEDEDLLHNFILTFQYSPRFSIREWLNSAAESLHNENSNQLKGWCHTVPCRQTKYTFIYYNNDELYMNILHSSEISLGCQYHVDIIRGNFICKILFATDEKNFLKHPTKLLCVRCIKTQLKMNNEWRNIDFVEKK